jgi:hypothetical protein
MAPDNQLVFLRRIQQRCVSGCHMPQRIDIDSPLGCPGDQPPDVIRHVPARLTAQMLPVTHVKMLYESFQEEGDRDER